MRTSIFHHLEQKVKDEVCQRGGVGGEEIRISLFEQLTEDVLSATSVEADLFVAAHFQLGNELLKRCLELSLLFGFLLGSCSVA